MAKLNSGASDKTADAQQTTTQLMDNLVITTNPVVITAVQRKANIGNYETIDIYLGVALPLVGVDLQDVEGLKSAIEEAANRGFYLTSKETGDRYRLIKDSLKE